MTSSTQRMFDRSTLSYAIYLLPLYNGRTVTRDGLESTAFFTDQITALYIKALFVCPVCYNKSILFAAPKTLQTSSQMSLRTALKWIWNHNIELSVWRLLTVLDNKHRVIKVFIYELMHKSVSLK